MMKGDWIIIIGILIIAIGAVAGAILQWYGNKVKNEEIQYIQAEQGELNAIKVDITKPFLIKLGV